MWQLVIVMRQNLFYKRFTQKMLLLKIRKFNTISCFFFIWLVDWGFSGVTLTSVKIRALQTVSSNMSPSRLSRTEFFLLFLFYGTENCLQHFSTAELSFSLNENYSFLLSGILNKAYHILTQTQWTFWWDPNVLMTLLILEQAQLCSYFP